MKKALFFALFFFVFAAAGKTACDDKKNIYVLVNTKECLNCYINLRQLMMTPLPSPVIFVFSKSDQNYAARFLTEQIGDLTHNYTIKASDSLFASLAAPDAFGLSQIVVVDGSRRVFSSSLKGLDFSALRFATNPATTRSTDPTAVAILDTLKLSARTKLTIEDQTVGLQDYNSGYAYSFSLQNPKRIHTFGPRMMSLRQAYQLYFGDTVAFHALRPRIPALLPYRKHLVRAENMVLAGKDTVYVVHGFSKLERGIMDGKSAQILATASLLVRYVGGVRQAWWSLPAEFKGGYYENYSSHFYVHAHTLYHHVVKEDLKQPNYVFAATRLDTRTHQAHFVRFLPPQLPSQFVKDSIVYEFYANAGSGRLFYFNYDGQAYDLLRGNSEAVCLPQKFRRASEHEFLVDKSLRAVQPVGKNQFRVLFSTTDSLYAAKPACPSYASAATTQRALPIGMQNLYSNPVLGKEGTLYYLDNRFRLMKYAFGWK